MMKPFILNRTEERRTRTKAQILLYAVKFWFVTRIGMGILLAGVSAVYFQVWGIRPQEELGYFSLGTSIAESMGWWALFYAVLAGPLLEECAFRLGLSFRRWQVAVGLGVLAFYIADSLLGCMGIPGALWVGIAVGAVAGGLLRWFTTAQFWRSQCGPWLRPAMWVSALLFGLMHLNTMDGLTWGLLPFALLTCLMLALSGCVFVYLRVNLGFWWAVAGHVFNNLWPGLVLLRLLLKN